MENEQSFMGNEQSSVEDEHPFIIKPYLKSELAQMYSPHLSPAGAMNKLGLWIRRSPALHALLYNGREGKNDITFSIRQVRLLFEHLGEP